MWKILKYYNIKNRILSGRERNGHPDWLHPAQCSSDWKTIAKANKLARIDLTIMSGDIDRPSQIWENSVPLIRWAGSKRKLLPILLSRMPKSFDRYIEPFAGSACLFFAAQPQRAIISDRNMHLIETYRTVVKHPIRVLRLAKSFSVDPQTYYSIRDSFQQKGSPILRAAQFLYLNRYCFNALYRTNKKGHFNVPFGSKTGGFISDDDFARAARVLGRADLVCSDFETTMRRARRGDFIYLDPPYVTRNRIDRNEYGPDSFGVCDIPRLVESLTELHQIGARFLLSYCVCPELLEMMPRKISHRVCVRRQIAATPSKRTVVKELLVDNADMFGEYPAN